MGEDDLLGMVPRGSQISASRPMGNRFAGSLALRF